MLPICPISEGISSMLPICPMSEGISPIPNSRLKVVSSVSSIERSPSSVETVMDEVLMALTVPV